MVFQKAYNMVHTNIFWFIFSLYKCFKVHKLPAYVFNQYNELWLPRELPFTLLRVRSQLVILNIIIMKSVGHCSGALVVCCHCPTHRGHATSNTCSHALCSIHARVCFSSELLHNVCTSGMTSRGTLEIPLDD